MAQLDQHLYDPPDLAASELAAISSGILANCNITGETVRLCLIDIDANITLPTQAIQMLKDILQQMALGRAVSVIPVNQELTTREAADLLNVERAYLIDHLLSSGKLPFHMVGKRHKILLKDVLLYKKQQKAETDTVMAELAALSQNLRMVDH